MKISVSSSVGVAQPSTLEVESTETFGQVREKVATMQAIAPDQISLVYKGDVQPLDKTLKNAGMKDGESLKAMPANPIGGVVDPSPLFLSEITRNRIANEAARVRAAGIELRPVTPLLWRGKVKSGGMWDGRKFDFVMELPRDFPARPPVVRFLNVFLPTHPNVSPTGHVCLNHLMAEWSPNITLAAIYDELEWLIRHPNFSHSFYGTHRPQPEERLGDRFRGLLGRI